MDRVKRIWYLSPMRAAKVQASLRIRAVLPEPSLLAHTSSEWRGIFRQKARSLGPLNGWACAVKLCHDGMLEDTNSLDGAHNVVLPQSNQTWGDYWGSCNEWNYNYSSFCLIKLNEQRHDKTNNEAVRPAKTQISLGMKKPWALNYPLRAQRRLWSDWADAQTDLSLLGAHSVCWFCHVAAQILITHFFKSNWLNYDYWASVIKSDYFQLY